MLRVIWLQLVTTRNLWQKIIQVQLAFHLISICGNFLLYKQFYPYQLNAPTVAFFIAVHLGVLILTVFAHFNKGEKHE